MIRIPSASTPAVITGAVTRIREAGLPSFVVAIIASYSMRHLRNASSIISAVRHYPTT